MKPSKEMCNGCYNNDYNFGLGGSKECWSFSSAKIEKKIHIPIDRRPPYDKKSAKNTMSCFNRKGYVHVKPENLTTEGYWKS